MAKTKKVLLITNIPTPYRIPLFNELSRQLNDFDIQLKVVFGALGYARRKWIIDMSECQFDYVVLSGKNIRTVNLEKGIFTYTGLLRQIFKEKPKLLIVSGFSIATIKVWFLLWIMPIQYIIWSGAIKRRGEDESLFRRLQRKILVRRADRFIAYGSKAKSYLISLGAEKRRIHVGINTVDTQFIKKSVKNVKKSYEENNTKKHLLYIGHLTKGKRIDHLLSVIKVLSNKRADFILNIVGSGPEMGNLVILVREMNLTDFVLFQGFKQKKDIPFFLSRADLFLFPSEYDIWGLVLVEAMSADVPCISSIHAGATWDLIKDDITGFAVDFKETEKVAEKINWLLDNPNLAIKIGQNANRYIEQNATLKKSASGFTEAIRNTLEV